MNSAHERCIVPPLRRDTRGVTCSESAHRLCETEHVRVTHARHWRSSLLEHNSSPSSDRLQSASIERDRENAACGSNRAVARSCHSLERIGGTAASEYRANAVSASLVASQVIKKSAGLTIFLRGVMLATPSKKRYEKRTLVNLTDSRPAQPASRHSQGIRFSG